MARHVLVFGNTIYIYTSGSTLNLDREPKIHYQTPMTCTYGYSHFKTVVTEGEIQFLRTWISLLPQFGSAFFSSTEGCPSTFVHIMNVQVNVVWCLVVNLWLKVCIQSHTRGVQLGLGLGFLQTSQVLPHWPNPHFSLILALYHNKSFSNYRNMKIWYHHMCRCGTYPNS